MKNAIMQPPHTPGEWKRRIAAKILIENKERDFNRDIIVDKIGIVAISVGSSLTECEANASRIVNAVNMHDNLIKALKWSLSTCIDIQRKKKSALMFPETASLGNCLEELLKEAEQK